MAVAGLVLLGSGLGTAACSPSAGSGPAAPAAPAEAAEAPQAAEGTAAPPAPTGFSVAREDAERAGTAPDGSAVVTWTSAWRLRWEPVPGAEAYEVRFGTAEGTAESAPARTVAEPTTSVDVAAGTSPPERLAQDREAQVLFTSSQLRVQVAAVAQSGEVGPASPWFAVGDVPPDGRPLPQADPEHDH